VLSDVSGELAVSVAASNRSVIGRCAEKTDFVSWGMENSTVVMLRHDLIAKRTRSLRRHEPQLGQRRDGGCAF
jgi:hypothetical protein